MARPDTMLGVSTLLAYRERVRRLPGGRLAWRLAVTVLGLLLIVALAFTVVQMSDDWSQPDSTVYTTPATVEQTLRANIEQFTDRARQALQCRHAFLRAPVRGDRVAVVIECDEDFRLGFHVVPVAMRKQDPVLRGGV